jgi:flagellar hook-associated protein 2
LIDVAVAAKTQQATQISTKITSNQAKITAYQGLQTALGTLSKDLTSLSNSIINSLSGSIFAQRSATISATGDLSASAALSMSLKPGATTRRLRAPVSRLRAIRSATPARFRSVLRAAAPRTSR